MGASGRFPAGAVLLAAFLVAPLLLDEVGLFKAGLVLIVAVGAMGLHLLVNWTGELSLAHAGLVGLPAFVVADLSSDHGISPILLLPVGALVGAVAGGVIGLPALRAKGLQVALVTLAAGIAIDRFFFTKDWLVGASGGVDVARPTLGPLEFTTQRALYAVVALGVAGAVGALAVMWRSKLARALLWAKADPQAASAFGIPVARYKVLAYCLAGAFAGFAGGMTALWVQRLTPKAFPFTLSFTYLIIVVLAGRGFVGGVIVAAVLIEGGRLFSGGAATLVAYGGPLMLITVLTRYRAGLNGIGERLMTELRRPTLVAGVAAVVAGFAAIGLAWYHAGNTDQVWIQNQEILSGGVGGLALVVTGAALLIRDAVTRSNQELGDRLEAVLRDNGAMSTDPGGAERELGALARR